MPKVKSLLKRAEVETAQRARTCKFSRKPIDKGLLCLVVYEDSRSRFCYSQEVALQMIGKAREALEEIEAELRG